ncbi:MAG: DUF4118 domain-containing protein [Pseudomonadales bacterium]
MLVLVAVVASAGVAHVLQPVLPLPSLSLVFLMGVLLVAVRTAPLPALAAALASALAYNFFFTEPRFTFYIHRTDELLTVVTFLTVGLIAGHVAGRLRQQMSALNESHEQTRTLAELNRRLAAAGDARALAEGAVSLLEDRLQLPTVILSRGEQGLERLAGSDVGTQLDPTSLDVARWVFDHRLSSGHLESAASDTAWWFAPLIAESEIFGVIGLLVGRNASPPPRSSMLEVIAGHVALAMARVHIAGDLRRAELAEESERLRSALLSSVSHDLKTPLASMLGAASTLRDLGEDLSPTDRRELADAIALEGARLNRYIQNLLDMTRLGQGTLKVERDWIEVDDILNAVVRRTADACAHFRVERCVPRNLPLLFVHPALIEQALVNVMENAARFSPPGGTITIEACLERDEMHLRISDEGPGIPAEDRQRVFDKFFTGSRRDGDSQHTGLGLTICAGMIAAHMGRVVALPGPNGLGTTIDISLSLIPAPGEDLSEASP